MGKGVGIMSILEIVVGVVVGQIIYDKIKGYIP